MRTGALLLIQYTTVFNIFTSNNVIISIGNFIEIAEYVVTERVFHERIYFMYEVVDTLLINLFERDHSVRI